VGTDHARASGRSRRRALLRDRAGARAGGVAQARFAQGGLPQYSRVAAGLLRDSSSLARLLTRSLATPHSSITTRKPTLPGLPASAAVLSRLAERHDQPQLNHDPPRMTRASPFVGPVGSISGPCW